MKLQVSPHSGWGWAKVEDYQFPMPSPFTLEAEVIEGGEPVACALGQITASGHSLHDMWALISHRPTDRQDHYNLAIFDDKPAVKSEKDRLKLHPRYWGVALVRKVQN